MASRRQLKISLDEAHYDRLVEVAKRSDTPMEAVVHQAIDRLAQEQTRHLAGARLLAAAPMPVDNWEILKEDLSEAAVGQLWRESD